MKPVEIKQWLYCRVSGTCATMQEGRRTTHPVLQILRVGVIHVAHAVAFVGLVVVVATQAAAADYDANEREHDDNDGGNHEPKVKRMMFHRV